MIKVKDIVEETIKKDHEALLCLSRGILNLSSYARSIHKVVEKKTKKEVKESTIVMALSRLKSYIEGTTPLVQDVKVDGLTVKTPLAEVVFEKTTKTLKQLVTLEKILKLRSDEWFMFSQNTKSIIILCSESRLVDVRKHMKVKPSFSLKNLAAIGLALSPDYHPESNVVFSLLHKIAEKRVPLAEVLSTWSEIIFVFNQEHLGEIIDIFQEE